MTQISILWTILSIVNALRETTVLNATMKDVLPASIPTSFSPPALSHAHAFQGVNVLNATMKDVLPAWTPLTSPPLQVPLTAPVFLEITVRLVIHLAVRLVSTTTSQLRRILSIVFASPGITVKLVTI